MKLSPEKIWEVEDLVNETIAYNNIPLGGLLANVLYSEFCFNEYPNTLLNRVKTIYHLLKLKRKPGATKAPATTGNGKYRFVFAFTADIPKLTDFFTLLVKRIPHDELLFVSREGELFRNKTSYNYYTTEKLNRAQHLNWKREFSTSLEQFRGLYNTLRSTFGLSTRDCRYLYVMFAYQTQRLMLYLDLLRQHTPECVLTDHDRQSLNSALVLAAKAMKIPAVTFIHGSTDPAHNYVPLLADKMLCWGQKHADQFTALGISPDRLPVAGNPRLKRTHTRMRKSLFHVMFISNPLELNDKLQLATVFCQAAQELRASGEIDISIKLHPNEDPGDYDTIKKQFSFARFISGSNINNDELLAKCDLVVSHNSTMAFDALVASRNVIILDLPGISFPLGIGEEMVTMAGCIRATNTAELVQAITQNRNDITQGISTPAAEEYIRYYCRYFGEESADHILSIITHNPI